MALLIIGFIIGVGFFIYDSGIDGFVDIIWCLSVGILGALAVSIIVAILIFAVVPQEEFVYEQSSEVPIVALKDNQGVVGTRFLFSGVTKSELNYYYAVESEYGIYIDKVSASSSHIRTDETNPRIQTYSCRGFKHWATWLYAVPLRVDYHIIYVPEGTIDRVYQIDLE